MTTEGAGTVDSENPKTNGSHLPLPPPMLFKYNNAPPPPPPSFGSKRACTLLSPPGGNDDAMLRALDESVQKTIEGQIHYIMRKITEELRSSIRAMIEKMKHWRWASKWTQERHQERKWFSDTRDQLCETEVLETYNRRINIKIFGLQEKMTLNKEGRMIGESIEESANHVL